MTHFQLMRRIELKRKQMIRSAQKSGLTAKQTIEYSQQLDTLLNLLRFAK